MLNSNGYSVQDKLAELIGKRWKLIVGLLLILLILLAFLSTASKQSTNRGIIKTPDAQTTPPLTESSSGESPIVFNTPMPTFSPQQLKAIQEQSRADAIVAESEVEIRSNYPWFIYLPLRGENYFVYFKPDKVVFVGRLYPKTGDNPEAMKAEIVKRLKEQFNIADVEKYPFEWEIIPK